MSGHVTKKVLWPQATRKYGGLRPRIWVSVTSKMLLPSATTNCGGLWPQKSRIITVGYPKKWSAKVWKKLYQNTHQINGWVSLEKWMSEPTKILDLKKKSGRGSCWNWLFRVDILYIWRLPLSLNSNHQINRFWLLNLIIIMIKYLAFIHFTLCYLIIKLSLFALSFAMFFYFFKNTFKNHISRKIWV